MTNNLRFGLAVLSGVLWALCFPKFNLWWLSLVCLLPLMIALQIPGQRETTATPKKAFQLGWTTGIVFFLILLYWFPKLPQENLTIPFFMYPALVLVALFYGLFPAVTAWGSAYLARRGAPLSLAFPALWVLTEFLRNSGYMGFTWGVLAYAMAPQYHLIQFASYTGVWGVSLYLVGVQGLIHGYFSLKESAPKILVAGLFFAAMLLPNFHGRSVIANRAMSRSIRVGLVQPNTGKNKWQPGVRDSVVAGLLQETRTLSEQGGKRPPVLIIWPETAIPARLPREPGYLYQVDRLVGETGIPLLAGYPDGTQKDGRWHFSNSAGLVLPNKQIVQQYNKRHLVPFSESFPLPLMNRYDFGQANFTPGKEQGLFNQLKEPFGVLICFESGFPELSRELVRNGARYLVNITNDQWFGDSAAPYQHFNFNVLRCIENRVAMARAANTGISGVIDPYGRVQVATPTFTADSRLVDVELGTGLTFYTRYGDWPLGVAGLMLFACAGFAFFGIRGSKKSGPTP